MSESSDRLTVAGPACSRCSHLRYLHGQSGPGLDPCTCCDPRGADTTAK